MPQLQPQLTLADLALRRLRLLCVEYFPRKVGKLGKATNLPELRSALLGLY